jgi:tetratricopeptide (TPR) repeat protein
MNKSNPSPSPHPVEMGALTKYNPQLWSARELRAIFVARQRELDTALQVIKSATRDDPSHAGQHLLVTGPRGMGKTTLLHRIALSVEDDPGLSPHWTPLRFPEELYTVSTPGEFWSRVFGLLIDHLAYQGQATTALDVALQALYTLEPAAQETQALAHLQTWCTEQGRKLILLVDNTDLLFNNLAAADPARAHHKSRKLSSPAIWSLREVLQHAPHFLWIGGSYLPLESQGDYNDAFLDFFQAIELKPMTEAEMHMALLALARAFAQARNLTEEKAEEDMQRSLAQEPARLPALRILTGGNPRALAYLYELILSGGEASLRVDLDRMLDNVTALYKHRLEVLPEQSRKVFAHLLEAWNPINAADLAKAARLPTGTVSTHLARLQADGLVQGVRTPLSKRTHFQASERLFNIWYLMRAAGRSAKIRVQWLVEFLRLWYNPAALTQHIGLRYQQLQSGSDFNPDDILYARALSMASTDADSHSKGLSWLAFRASQNKPDLASLFADTPQEPYTEASNYLQRLQALRTKLERCPHPQTREEMHHWCAAILGLCDRRLTEKEQIADASPSLDNRMYQFFCDLAASETYALSEIVTDVSATQSVKDSVVSGAFFPEAPFPTLALPQIQANFSGDRNAFWLAVNIACGHTPSLTREGVRDYEKAFGEEARSQLCLANWLAKQNDSRTEAEAAYRKAIELDPKSARPWFSLGNALLNDMRRYDDAEVAFRQAIELEPKAARPWNNLGYLLQVHLQRPDDAEAAYRNAIELNPQEALPWINLGNLLQDQFWRPEEAESALRTGLALAPHDPYLLANRARLAGKRNDHKLADEQYRLSIEYAGADEQHLLLQAHLWLGNQDLALQALRRLAKQSQSEPGGIAFQRLNVQCGECGQIGLGPALADLMEACDYREFLLPMALALRQRHGNPDSLAAYAPEIQAAAETVVRWLTQHYPLAEMTTLRHAT